MEPWAICYAPLVVIGIDPGKNIGVAFVRDDGKLERAHILSLGELVGLELPVAATVVLGNGTGSRDIQQLLTKRHIPFELVDELNTSLEGRKLYFTDHPPKGLLRWLPKGLWSPPRPIDDYAAYAIALRFLNERAVSSQREEQC